MRGRNLGADSSAGMTWSGFRSKLLKSFWPQSVKSRGLGLSPLKRLPPPRSENATLPPQPPILFEWRVSTRT